MTKRIPPVLDDALGFNVYRLALLFRNELMRALADYGLTPEQWQILQALWSTDEELNQTDVAHLTLRDKPTVSRILSRLERDGWIRRRPHPDDARAYLIEPTERARDLRTKVPRALFRHFDPVVGALSDREQSELLRLLKKLRATLGDDCV